MEPTATASLPGPTSIDDPASENIADTSDDVGTLEDQSTTDTEIFDTDPNDADYQRLESQADSEAMDYSTEDPSTLDDGDIYVSIVDSTNSYALLANDDGNLYFTELSRASLFQSNNSVVTADDAERVFLYYTDELQAYGVSRFRLTAETLIPVTCGAIALMPFTDGSTVSSDLFAVNSRGDVFFPVLCNIQGQTSKLFLVNDLDKGPITLTDPSLIYTVTGGIVTDCSYIPIKITAAQEATS